MVEWLHRYIGFPRQRFNRLTIELLFLILSACCFSFSARAVESNESLTQWLSAQQKIKTWSAEFTQTRTLKSFAEPLVSTGRVWFAAPNQFRWELGNPAQTIAVRQKEQMLVIYPKLKRAEKYSLAGDQPGQFKDLLALLEAGFPRSREEIEARFNIQSIETKAGICEVTLQPKSSQARRMMPEMKIAFSPDDFSLRATELKFADGSTMRNDFKSPKLNETLNELLFSPEIPATFKVVEPMKHSK